MSKHPRTACVVFMILLPLLLAGLLWLGEAIPGARDVDFLARSSLLNKVWRADQPFRCLVGSSRVLWGIDPKQMGGTGLTFNFGVAGGGPVQSFFTLERLVRLHRKPDQLVVEAWWFQAARDNATPHWYSLLSAGEQRQFRQWSENPAERTDSLPRIARLSEFMDWPVRYLCPRWDPEYARAKEPADPFGWTPPETSEHESGELEQRYQTVLREHRRALPHFPRSGGGTAALCSVLELCRRERVQAILLLAPDSPSYRIALGSQHAQREKAFWLQLSHNYGVTVLDTSEWGSDSDFLDGVHLRGSAVKAYSKHIARLLGPIVTP